MTRLHPSRRGDTFHVLYVSRVYKEIGSQSIECDHLNEIGMVICASVCGSCKASVSVIVSLLWIVDSERDRLIVVDRGTRSVPLIESAQATPKSHLPYGMFFTRLFRHVMEHYPHLDNGIYNVVDHVMRPLALRQTRRPRSDRGKARHSVSSTSAHHNLGSSSRQGDDDEDDGASRASTLSPTTYLSSLKPLDYQQYDVPTSSEQNDDLLFERQTDLLNQTQQMHKELRGGFKSFGKALRGVFRKKKK
ncbi:hypothetical protein Tco_0909443 [Tanacetum coccineum]|uniref:Uncharacterized protein n=1 Tax=Tanacetum coccineum TaxID=301880 RepID=A0ABQ5CQI3_9ASTR